MAAKENVLTKTDDLLRWFLPKIEKFPRNYKFLFGDRLVQIQLDLLEDLIDACGSPGNNCATSSHPLPAVAAQNGSSEPRLKGAVDMVVS